MKIGVISDTHVQANDCQLTKELTNALKSCDMIVHAGDFVDKCILEELTKISKLEAVSGNMDSTDVKSLLPEKKILTIAEKKICLFHGYGHPDKLVDILKEMFYHEKPDIIIFGHSHVPMNKYIDGILFFNPGSATDTVYAPYRSYGIIEIKDNIIEAAIHKL